MSAEQPIRLVRGLHSGRWTLEVAGHRIENDVHGLTLTATGPDYVELVVRLRTAPIDVQVEGPARVELDVATVLALRRLGWTPPAPEAER